VHQESKEMEIRRLKNYMLQEKILSRKKFVTDKFSRDKRNLEAQLKK